MNEQAPTSPAAPERDASQRKPWVNPEIQELDHELTGSAVSGPTSDGGGGYSGTV